MPDLDGLRAATSRVTATVALTASDKRIIRQGVWGALRQQIPAAGQTLDLPTARQYAARMKARLPEIYTTIGPVLHDMRTTTPPAPTD